MLELSTEDLSLIIFVKDFDVFCKMNLRNKRKVGKRNYFYMKGKSGITEK